MECKPMRIQTETNETFLNTAAFLAPLNLPALVGDEVTVPASDEAGRRRSPTTAALDAFEEHLKAGGKVEANPDQPKVPYWKAIATELKVSAALLSAKHLPYRKRILALAATYGLEPAPAEPTPMPFADFAVIAVAHRDRELEGQGAEAGASDLAAFSAVMEEIASECDPALDARDVLVSVVTAADAKLAGKSAVFFKEASRALGYLGHWDANEDLPRNPAHLLRYALARSGLSQSKVAKMAGVNQGTLSNWFTGKRGPVEAHFARVNLVESAMDLPIDSATTRFSAWRRQIRPSPIYGSTDYGKAAQWRIQHPYCMHVWSERQEAEFAAFCEFRNAPLNPFGMKRPKGRLGAKTIQMQRDWLASVYGSWTTALHRLQMAGGDMTMALFVFPRMLRERLEFALARDAAAKGAEEGALTKFEIDQIRWVKSLLDPETGWLTQMPDLAERLVPVTKVDGTVIVSDADIARVRADWTGACAAARTAYADMKASNLQHVKVSRDPHEAVRPILLMDNPLSALATLCRGLERDMAGLDPVPLAYASRDAFIIGMLAQVGFRKGTVEAMELDDIFYDETKGKWCLRVPAKRFKNGKSGPYFGKGFGRRHHYERDLMDSHGLYAAIEGYLKAGRRLILGDCETSALFVVSPYERCGLRKQQYSWCEKGRMTTAYLGRLVHGITGKYLRYDAETGAGIPGITSFPGHAIRHILATGVLKQAANDPQLGRADPWYLAADAIQDGVRTVEIYVQYLPRDRQDELMAVLERGLIDG